MKNAEHTLDRTFFAAGVNYRTAPVEVRERMAAAHLDRIEVSKLLQLKAGLSEIVVLWTCNRVEIYGVAARDLRGSCTPGISMQSVAIAMSAFVHGYSRTIGRGSLMKT